MQFNEHFDISHGFNRHGASRGPSATAKLLVYICDVANSDMNTDLWFRCCGFLASEVNLSVRRV